LRKKEKDRLTKLRSEPALRSQPLTRSGHFPGGGNTGYAGESPRKGKENVERGGVGGKEAKFSRFPQGLFFRGGSTSCQNRSHRSVGLLRLFLPLKAASQQRKRRKA